MIEETGLCYCCHQPTEGYLCRECLQHGASVERKCSKHRKVYAHPDAVNVVEFNVRLGEMGMEIKQMLNAQVEGMADSIRAAVDAEIEAFNIDTVIRTEVQRQTQELALRTVQRVVREALQQANMEKIVYENAFELMRLREDDILISCMECGSLRIEKQGEWADGKTYQCHHCGKERFKIIKPKEGKQDDKGTEDVQSDDSEQ